MAECSHCGAPLPDGTSFCSECGAKIEPIQAPVPPEQEKPKPAQHTYQPIQQIPEDSKPLSTIAFIGLEILYVVPFVGFIVCIILCFAPKNKNIRSFSRSKLILAIVGIVLAIIGAIAVGTLFSEIFTKISSEVNSGVPGSIDVEGLVNSFFPGFIG